MQLRVLTETSHRNQRAFVVSLHTQYKLLLFICLYVFRGISIFCWFDKTIFFCKVGRCLETSFSCIVHMACCPSTNTKTSLVTKQRLCDALAKETDLVLKERMPSGLPGERTDKADGSDKATIAGNCQSIAMDTIVFLFVRKDLSPHRGSRFSKRELVLVTLNRVQIPVQYIYSSTVLKYSFEVAGLYFSVFLPGFTRCHHIRKKKKILQKCPLGCPYGR